MARGVSRASRSISFRCLPVIDLIPDASLPLNGEEALDVKFTPITLFEPWRIRAEFLRFDARNQELIQPINDRAGKRFNPAFRPFYNIV